jgi:hypothetical protein
MKVLDLWCGTKSATMPFEDSGFEIVSVDINEKFNPTICKDIIEVTVNELRELGPFVFGWASVECKVYSVANLHSRHWKTDQEGRTTALTEAAREMNERVKHTIALLEILCPVWVIENPRGMLRKQSFMLPFERHTVAYCTYGDSRQKPTDLWGRFPQYWAPRRMCSPSASCHDSAPRGTSDSGTLALSYEDRIRVPYYLGVSLMEAAIKANWEPQPTLRDF